tara:strand:+ start:227 stop:1711 length:1485 start_codon:yes stop_codon:yes gene_type:complete
MHEVLEAWISGRDYTHGSKGFMGKEWDSFVPGPALWSEVVRTMKPGAHLLSFAGSRTYDLMAVAIRLAELEIRDQVMWLYGSGFPKSHNISKAIDKLDAADARTVRRYKFTEWFVSACSLTAREMDKVCDTNTMGRHWTDVRPKGKQPDVPTREYFEKLRPHITCKVPKWVEDLVDQRTVESENFKRREVTSTKSYSVSEASVWGQNSAGGRFEIGDHSYNETASHTDAAKQWDGWGTALKPAHEPLVLARKPFKGTVANNVLEHGTGAINVDGCRVGSFENKTPSGMDRLNAANATQGYRPETYQKGAPPPPDAVGRFPANVIHDGSDEVVAGFPAGSARFFYCAKANKSERDFGLDDIPETLQPHFQTANGTSGKASSMGSDTYKRNTHPTVKPVALMSYLIRLITPLGGTVLDPFMGSGTTGMAAILEGRHFIGIERDPEYFEIACSRLEAVLANPSQVAKTKTQIITRSQTQKIIEGLMPQMELFKHLAR